MEGLRFAGERFGYDLKKDFENELRDLIRKERSTYAFGSDFYDMSPENSEPEYTMSGGYQPSVAYGR